MISIAQLWQEFLTTTYRGAVHMPPAQRRELRLNFYSGFYKALTAIADVGTEPDPIRKEQMIGQYIDEWRKFTEDYLQERQGEQ